MVAGQDDVGVAVLYNESHALAQGEPQDLIAVQGVIACARAVAEVLHAAGRRVALVPMRGDVEAALASYAPAEWAVFNLGEGVNSRLFDEARTAWAIEAMGYRFTGNRGEALARSTNKAQAKACLAQAGVPTPAWRLYRHPAETALDPLPFPLFVKPVAEDASQGIGPQAVVQDRAALEERVAYILTRYRQAALAEQFVAGREFNVSLWGDPPVVLPLAEIDFSAFTDPLARVITFAAKWEEESFEYRSTPVQCPADVDPALAERIRGVARQAWEAIGCRGYARVDMRLDESGTPYVIEVNCNPDISPDAGFFRAARAAGHTYQGMALRILETAFSDQRSAIGDQQAQLLTADRRFLPGGAHMIGPARETDGRHILAIAAGAGVFSAEEVATVQELWEDYLQHGEADYAFRVYREGEEVLGFTCHGRRDLTAGTYDLFWIATDIAARRKGVARALMAHVEEEIQRGGGRLIVVETSGTPAYQATRDFYLACGYENEATIRDFYQPGDDLVVFTKHLGPPASV